MTTTNQKPLILITNDDGDAAKGIEVLTRMMLQLGDVIVVSPDGQRSGQSNALTVNNPIRFKKIQEQEGLTWYISTGTPTDCVKLALNGIVDRKPDLLVAGVNHGSNAAINVIYSGTMGAVLEGCINGINSIGFSILDHSANADFSNMEPYILEIAKKVLEKGLPTGVCLNVNSPCDNIQGIKITSQCSGKWVKEYENRTDPQGRPYFWLTGHFQNNEPENEETDEWALGKGYVTIVPTKIDLTDYDFMDELKKWEFSK
jgi:5'-nucleotidase